MKDLTGNELYDLRMSAGDEVKHLTNKHFYALLCMAERTLEAEARVRELETKEIHYGTAAD